MKAARIHGYGHTEQLHVEEAPSPNPSDDDVLVKVHTAGVNPVDWKLREGLLKDVMPKRFPFVSGQDFAGEVSQLGRDVPSGLMPGDHVFGFAKGGSYAELAIASPDVIAKKPATLDFEQAAAIPTAGLTAWQLVHDVANISPGMFILIHGAAGGVGSIVVQLAHAKGARIVSTSSRADFSYLKSLGVEQTIDYKSEDFEEQIIEPCDVVIDLVGGETLKRSYSVVRIHGLIVTTTDSIDTEECERRSIRGVEYMMKPSGAQLAELAQAIDHGVVKPRLSQIFQLSNAREAQDLSQSGKAHGKIVLQVA